ncbi:ketoacyl-ACP synthase III [Pedobacter sp. P351]|uniref:3-oxoacyl-ACP synthase III family protein n=1 Tax=Pedobacter superstes TaxID=3133441 RepID=UPI0030AD7158
MGSVIIGTGSYLPTKKVLNSDFLAHRFFEKDGIEITKDNEEIISKFVAITTIEERLYASDDLVASDMGLMAAEEAIKSSGIDPETLDYIIVAQNFGDISPEKLLPDVLPTLAARIKHKLKIKNPECVAYDIPFGCPGWLQGVIQADYYLRSGDAKRILVIGTETLSRITDPHDRDSMIYADGAGAVILESQDNDRGILSHKTRSDTFEEAYYLYSGGSSNADFTDNNLYIKMDGRKIYEYALTNVPLAIKQTLDKAGHGLKDVKKILIHQANGKMDEAILKRLYKLYNETQISEDIMPMTIAKLGNSSVATLPTLLDLILKGELENHQIEKDDIIVFASVGAGMNINAVVYRY